MGTPLRKCNVCGLEAHTEEELEPFVKDARVKYGRLNKCLKCFAEYKNKRRKPTKKYKARQWTKRVERTREEKKIIFYANFMARSIEAKDKCELCGCDDTQLVKHHDDYSKPLEIRTLCRRCHYFVHQIASEAELRFKYSDADVIEKMKKRKSRSRSK